jgi:hypothetical protein
MKQGSRDCPVSLQAESQDAIPPSGEKVAEGAHGIGRIGQPMEKKDAAFHLFPGFPVKGAVSYDVLF